MRKEIARKYKSNNAMLLEIRQEIQNNKRVSIKDILKAADLIKHIKQINATYSVLLNE